MPDTANFNQFFIILVGNVSYYLFNGCYDDYAFSIKLLGEHAFRSSGTEGAKRE